MSFRTDTLRFRIANLVGQLVHTRYERASAAAIGRSQHSSSTGSVILHSNVSAV